MAEYDNTNKGSLFKNDDKKEDTHADYNGSINVGGKEYWLNAWLKTAGEQAKKPGAKFFSLSVKEKTQVALQPQSAPVVASNDFDSDIPF